MWVLEFVRLHVLPQGLNDDRSGLGVDAEHASQSGVQFKLGRLRAAKRRNYRYNRKLFRQTPVSLLSETHELNFKTLSAIDLTQLLLHRGLMHCMFLRFYPQF